MNKQLFNPPGHYDSLGWYTHALRTRGGTTLFVSGQVAFDTQRQIVGPRDLRTQARPAFRNLKTGLTAAGPTPADVVKMNVYVVNYAPADLPALGEGMTECFGAAREFASTVVGVQALARDGLLIEVEAVAVLP